ncbi:hypothetical protein B0181_00760 [Moraxella caviae]|uniref:Uncharacterized protein n=1 Tax=Moraxella caviae TaxID=34060 RepID=A0A1T0ABW0_9GAMM|nr:hypothetical protein [Moraxella caviae]OOR93206.1 hypothetical protein B0181_00760 [Moraxella caviae]STZ10478.1 Uncharacterised protein [Moraxella caviae]VEW12802.1 Uncharacterised protein [Moraxella caviae]
MSLKPFLWAVLAGVSFTAHAANAEPVAFDHIGVQAGKTIESCYREPCSSVKVLEFDLLDKSADSAMLGLTLTDPADTSNDKWKVFVNCSIDSPTVIFGRQTSILPINPEMALAGVLQSTYALYAAACHGGYEDEMQLASKFGYNVADW